MNMKKYVVLFNSEAEREDLVDALKGLGIRYACVEIVGDSFSDALIKGYRDMHSALVDAYEKLKGE